jgi:hypothetical protein
MVEKVSTVEALSTCTSDVMLALRKLLEPLPTDAVFAMELLKKIFQCTAANKISLLVTNAMRAQLPEYVLVHIVGASSEALASLKSASALRVYAVDMIKAMQLVADPSAQAQLSTLLNTHSAWESYRHQAHDLFLLQEEKTDYFLSDTSDDKFRLLLTDASISSTDMVAYFTSNTTTSSPAPFADRSAPSVSTSSASSSVNPYTPTPEPSPSQRNTLAPASHTLVLAHAPSIEEHKQQAFASSLSPPSASAGERYVTVLEKSEHGLGLDLEKRANRPVVKRLKAMPPGVENPALRAKPVPVVVGDTIVAVNGVDCDSFALVVDAIRSSGQRVELTLIRGV